MGELFQNISRQEKRGLSEYDREKIDTTLKELKLVADTIQTFLKQVDSYSGKMDPRELSAIVGQLNVGALRSPGGTADPDFVKKLYGLQSFFLGKQRDLAMSVPREVAEAFDDEYHGRNQVPDPEVQSMRELADQADLETSVSEQKEEGEETFEDKWVDGFSRVGYKNGEIDAFYITQPIEPIMANRPSQDAKFGFKCVLRRGMKVRVKGDSRGYVPSGHKPDQIVEIVGFNMPTNDFDKIYIRVSDGQKTGMTERSKIEILDKESE